MILNYKTIKFLVWSMAIWGAGDAINEATQGRYTNAGISIGMGIVWVLVADRLGRKVEKEWAERLKVISKRFTHKSRNNYRKLHSLPLIRRLRCRWRPRESRRSLSGLSPDITIIDELHEWR